MQSHTNMDSIDGFETLSFNWGADCRHYLLLQQEEKEVQERRGIKIKIKILLHLFFHQICHLIVVGAQRLAQESFLLVFLNTKSDNAQSISKKWQTNALLSFSRRGSQ